MGTTYIGLEGYHRLQINWTETYNSETKESVVAITDVWLKSQTDYGDVWHLGGTITMRPSTSPDATIALSWTYMSPTNNRVLNPRAAEWKEVLQLYSGYTLGSVTVPYQPDGTASVIFESSNLQFYSEYYASVRTLVSDCAVSAMLEDHKPLDLYIKLGGQYTTSTDVYKKVGGVWVPVSNVEDLPRGKYVWENIPFTPGVPRFVYTGSYAILADDGSPLTQGDPSTNWRIKFLTSGSLRFVKLGSIQSGAIDVFCVGGGGGGRRGANAGGGGGGYTTTGEATVALNTEYIITIGSGGSGATATGANGVGGGVTSALDVTASGGNGGGSTPVINHGGSGGGSYKGVGGTDGGNGGNGKYVGGTGQGTTTREFGEATGGLYAGGGAGGSASSNTIVEGGAGGGGTGSYTSSLVTSGAVNTGGGGGGGYEAAGSGGSGVVVIRNAR